MLCEYVELSRDAFFTYKEKNMKKTLTHIIALLLLLAAAKIASAQTIVQGDVSGTWTVSGSPYLVIASIRVPSGQVLTIQPGVTVRFGLGLNLTVGGVMRAIGTITDSIRFTTAENVPSPGQWGQIIFSSTNSADTSIIQYCTVQYGGSNNTRAVAVSTNRTALLILNSRLSYNNIAALLGGGVTLLRQSSVTNNVSYGIEIARGKSVIDSCVVNSNSLGIVAGSDSAQVSISASYVRQNNSGGVLFSAMFSSLTISYSYIQNNLGSGISTGGNYLYYPSSVTLRSISVTNNNGWGISNTQRFMMDSCLISGNASGGLSNSTFGSPPVSVQNSVFSYNRGSAVRRLGNNCTLDKNMIVSNSAGITNIESNSNVLIRNNIIAYNSGAGVHSTVTPAPTVVFNNVFANTNNFSGFSTFYGDTTLGYRNGRGDRCDPFSNVNMNPLFVDTTARNYHLLASSHMIDAGDTLSPKDPDSTIADIGAYYFDHRTQAIGAVSNIPYQFWLAQNYPNPFNPSTTFHFSLPRSTHVSLKLYDLTGREVAIIVDHEMTAGSHTVAWKAANFASGIYFYSLKAAEYTNTKKLILLK